MSGDLGPHEVIGFGHDRGRSTTGRGPVRRHPRIAGGIAFAVVVGLIAVAAVELSPDVAEPELPTLSTARAVPAASASISFPGVGEDQSRWSTGADGRPVGPATIVVPAVLAFDGVPPTGVEVLGLAGPGMTATTDRLAQFGEDATRKPVTFEVPVDCASVPLPVPDDAYGVRVRISGSGPGQGTLAAGLLGTEIARTVGDTCGSWIARRDLTVTSATAQVDPRRIEVTLRLTVTNDGREAAALTLADVGDTARVTARPTGIVRIPAGGATQIVLDVGLPQCDAVTGGTETGLEPPATTSDSVLGLVALVGSDPDGARARPWLTGEGPTGVVLTAAASDVVSRALREACGNLGGFAVLIADGGARYDRASRTLTITVEIDGTPGKVRDVRLVSRPPAEGEARALTPLWSTTPRLIPDRTGQSITTLRYRSPRTTVCPGETVRLPGFTVVARVPASAGLRTVRFAQFVDPWQDPTVLRELCPVEGPG